MYSLRSLPSPLFPLLHRSLHYQPSPFKESRSGLLCIDKPFGVTCLNLLYTLRKPLRRTDKLGHAGTLDRDATGILVVGLGKYCKILHTDALHYSKTYRGVGRFGLATDSMEIVGKKTKEMAYQHINQELLLSTLEKFKGNIQQTPPLYSALKQDGRRISDLVREGVEVDIEAKRREVQVFNIKLISFNLPDFEIEVECSKGTYIRSLIHDIGDAVGSCAVTVSIRRTHQAMFGEEDCLKEDKFGDFSAILQNIHRSTEIFHRHQNKPS